MAIDQVVDGAWTRKHDMPGQALIPHAPKILYPKSLEELIALCAERAPGESFKAAGSHWALSEAAISDQVFIETHDPNDQFNAMSRTLYEVVPNCLSAAIIDVLAKDSPPPFEAPGPRVDQGSYFVHFEAGKRIYQLYSELDLGDDDKPQSLARYLKGQFKNDSYMGSWAFPTLGGAGGQTVFGALTTGTHGGDFLVPPIADSVMALHLVADGGRHYWIEPKTNRYECPLTDDDKLMQCYGDDKYRGKEQSGRDNFEIIRDNDIFNAVLVSAGRFGIVYSVVLRAVRQYSLHEDRKLDEWQNVRSRIANLESDLYKSSPPPAAGSENPQRFLQIAVCLTPHSNFTKNVCGITKRWIVPMAVNPTTSPPAPSGRNERRGKVVGQNVNTLEPVFEWAGQSHSYNPDKDKPNQAAPITLLSRACSHDDFLDGAIDAVIQEIGDLINNNKVAVGGAIAAVILSGAGAGIAALIPPLAIILALLMALFKIFKGHHNTRLGEALNTLKDGLLNQSDPLLLAAGVFTWQCIAYKLFTMQQAELQYEAISYAVMDTHDYLDKSCMVNVESTEVFFDATDPMLPAFIDALIAFEIGQEGQGRAFVGYASLRFTGPTQALLGMEGQPAQPGTKGHLVTCAVEVAGLKDVTGTTSLVDYAISLALSKNFRGILHWGQRNESTMANIQDRFGDGLSGSGGNLRVWRNALSRLTQNGQLSGFSSEFTRRVGLEIVVPEISAFTSSSLHPTLGQTITIDWNCSHNPPTAEVIVSIQSPDASSTVMTAQPLSGQRQLLVAQHGIYNVRLTAVIELNGEKRKTSSLLTINVA